MNWDAIGAIGEIIGALAVVASLIYLSIQIRNQNKESKVASVHEINEAYRAITAEMMKPEIAAVWAKAQNGFGNLDETEKLQVISFALVCFRFFEEAYYQFKANRLDDHIWEGMSAQITLLMGSESFVEIWSMRKHMFSPDFRNIVDALETSEYEI